MKMRHLSTLLLGSLLLFSSCGSGVYEKNADGITVNVSQQTADNSVRKVRLMVYGDKIIRVSATPDKKFSSDESLVVLPRDKAAANFTVEETDSTVTVVTPELRATVSVATGDVKFYNKDGKLIVSEADGGRSFSPIEVEGTKGYTVRQVFESLNDNEGIYGLGQT